MTLSTLEMPPDKDVAERILAVLRHSGPLRARRLARVIGIDASAVNRALFRMSMVVQKDAAHRWSLRPRPDKAATMATPAPSAKRPDDAQ